MSQLHDGQCGLCQHFGENEAKSDVLINIVSKKEADLAALDSCGLPKNAAIHLKVSPISGCDGFVAAAAA